ncbi:MAG: hypothetical protein ACLU3I_14365 [Acutalibacteraceae bacterium]
MHEKTIFSVLLALVLLLCAVPLPVHAAANEITVYNWGQYISDGTDDSLDVITGVRGRDGHQGQLPDVRLQRVHVHQAQDRRHNVRRDHPVRLHDR